MPSSSRGETLPAPAMRRGGGAARAGLFVVALEDGAGPLEAGRRPGVLPQQPPAWGFLVAAGGGPAVELEVDEELAALLLGQGQRAELRAETGVEGQAVGAP